MIHHRHADRRGILEAEADVTDAIANKNDIDNGIGDARGDRIVGGRRDKAAPPLLPALQQLKS
jgi:hypothetical protein